MNNKIYELKNGEVTVFLKSKYGQRGEFEFAGVSINNNPDVVYVDYVSTPQLQDSCATATTVNEAYCSGSNPVTT